MLVLFVVFKFKKLEACLCIHTESIVGRYRVSGVFFGRASSPKQKLRFVCAGLYVCMHLYLVLVLVLMVSFNCVLDCARSVFMWLRVLDRGSCGTRHQFAFVHVSFSRVSKVV